MRRSTGRPWPAGAGKDDVPGILAREHARLGAGRDVGHGPPQRSHLAPDERQARLVAHIHNEHAPLREERRGLLVEPGAGNVLRCLRPGEDVQDDDVEMQARGQLGQGSPRVADDRVEVGPVRQRQPLQHEVQQLPLQLHGVLHGAGTGRLDVPCQGQCPGPQMQSTDGFTPRSGEVHDVPDAAQVFVEDVLGVGQVHV